MRFVLALLPLVSLVALAQVPTFDATAAEVVQQAKVTATVTGGHVYLYPDGGCMVQPDVMASVPIQPKLRKARPSICAAAANVFAAAARLDLGVADAGTP